MSGPVFDKNLDPLGDLTLKMTNDLEPELDDDNIEPNVESVEEAYESPQTTPVENIFVKKEKKRLEAIKETPMEDTLQMENLVGDRGKDKKKRKKRTMTPAALEKLAAARQKSLATRKAKAAVKREKIEAERVSRALKRRADKQELLDKQALNKYEMTKNQIPIERENVKIKAVERVKAQPQQATNVFGDFDMFCNYMERYDERKRKKHTTSSNPHPNQKIPERQRPRPPVQQANRNPQFRTTGGARNKPPADFSPYSLLKSGRGSVFGRSGMNGGNNTGW
tara:strand:+ start:364 stop:1206 length:843 start_codon:yes stop_codon:yes gene_type:complete